LTEFLGTAALVGGAGLVEEVVAPGLKVLDAVADGRVVGAVEVGTAAGSVDLAVAILVDVAEVAVRAGGLGVADGKAELLFVGPRGEEGQGCKGEPSLVRFRLWRMGTSEAAWQVPYLADLPKVLLRNATRFASVTTVNPPPSSQFLVTVILWSRR
jgi:hypothetical protein